MRLLLATDAAAPQVNGVVRSLEQTAAALDALGVRTEFLTPDEFRTVPLPGYPEIRLAHVGADDVARRVSGGRVDAVHVATEGPVGLAARRFCRSRRLRFTTSYHTRFPEYLRARLPVPLAWSYRWLRWFHGAADTTLVATEALRAELSARGFQRLAPWTRGVDTGLFRPEAAGDLGLPRPIFLSVGRLAVEKNLPAFLSLPLPGSKVVVGEGPERARLEAAFPEATFMGVKTGRDLARIYAAADVFVFPSLTDTFGIVLLEALASGLPIAAFPVPAIREVLEGDAVGVLDADLTAAAIAALAIPAERCRAAALRRSWDRSARQFLAHLAPLRGAAIDGTADVPPAFGVPASA